MQFFSRKSFEHLLFPLHTTAYREIERQLQALEQRYPGTIKSLCTVFDLNFANATTEGAVIPIGAVPVDHPAFDIHVEVETDLVKLAHDCERVKVWLVPQTAQRAGEQADSNHLILGLRTGNIHQSFIVPLPLVLKTFEARVSKPNTFQVYQHTLIRQPSFVAVALPSMAPTPESYVAGAAEYVGITSRTWQKRAEEHQRAARRGSMLLFHRGLREELFAVNAHEHIVLRAGLTRAQALRIEEVEVEKRTLREVHPNGLNMIPGGEAGLRFLSRMTKQPCNRIPIDDIDGLLETVVNQSLRQPGLSIAPSAMGKGVETLQTNLKLAALWQDDIRFRIKAMTNSARRLSYQQICSARIWDAAGWAMEKIHAHIHGMDGRACCLSQLQQLLVGKTYASIPHVLIPIAE